MGGGAVFFAIDPLGQAYLNDSNAELVETYQQIRDQPDLVIRSLKRLKNSKKEYYAIRKRKPIKPYTRAARFIYLNRCSFNGIYRVNSLGGYNVPYGHRKNVDIVTAHNLHAVSSVLQNRVITCTDFSAQLDNVCENDLVFLDPPYTVAHENNGFIEYNQKLFSWEDQIRLRSFVEDIERRGAYFILTNASHESILRLYDDIGTIYKRSRYSQVGGRNKTRGMYNELIITNVKE